MRWSLTEPNRVVLNRSFGLGDTLMATVPMGLLWQRHGFRFEIACRCMDVFADLPFVAGLHWRDGTVRGWPEVSPGGAGDGPGGTHRHLAAWFETGESEEAERRLWYEVRPQEAQWARGRLIEMGWQGERILGIQIHGGWQTKRWKRWPELAKAAQRAGWFVVTSGDNRDIPLLSQEVGVQTLVGKTPSVRELAAFQSQMSCWQGFDSGGSYLAHAVGCPSVWLWATHNPEDLLGQCGRRHPYICVYPNWQERCFAEHGRSCRHHPDNSVWCPLRQGLPEKRGADCLDSISAPLVWEMIREITD